MRSGAIPPHDVASLLEKASFAIAVSVLYLQQRVHAALVPFAVLDVVLGALFLVAFWKTR
jgi:hypothetical protein